MCFNYLCLFIFIILINYVNSVLNGRHFKFGDDVSVLVSNVAPFHNPTEKYPYTKLPWPCHTKGKSKQGLGSVISGEKNQKSSIEIKFLKDIKKTSICGEKSLTNDDVNIFIDSITNEYQYEMWIDDLPVFGRVGFASINEQSGSLQYFLITHRHFFIRYNNDQIITVNISTRLQPGDYIEITKNNNIERIDYTYAITWDSTQIKYANRWKTQLNSFPTKYQVEAHWLWILNSTLLVILLTGLFATILLRTLKNDVARYLQVPEIDQAEAEERRKLKDTEDLTIDESGWKKIKGDVFRGPPYPYLFSSIIGVGAQILLIVMFLLILAAIGYFYPGNHGRIYVAAILMYSFTAYVAGYVSSAKLKEICPQNHDWMISCLFTSTIFAAPFLFIFASINTTAIVYGSSIALPFATILAIILLWAFVTFPLTAFGSYRGKKAIIQDYPSHTRKIAKPLPKDLPWYYNHYLLALTAGFLPFMAMYVEIHTIFMSVWGHQPYSLFGILLLTFIILLIVTSCVVILMCYFQLTAEDYTWWWASIIRGSACGGFMYAYAIYYWFYSAHMTGTLQFVAYFGYTLMLSYAFGLMLAAVAHWASRAFVIKIYAAIKSD